MIKIIFRITAIILILDAIKCENRIIKRCVNIIIIEIATDMIIIKDVVGMIVTKIKVLRGQLVL